LDATRNQGCFQGYLLIPGCQFNKSDDDERGQCEVLTVGVLNKVRRKGKMGNEGLLGLSPAHRRGLNPPSPTPFKRTTSGPDIGWRSLVHRHKFLLYALGLLTFLCTIYLYFAITLGTRDVCSGLGGEQRALCQVGNKAREANHLRRLMFVDEDSGMYVF
jgi:hypothetical protein